MLNVAPNSGGAGPAIWMAGGGPAADGAGNVYLLTANGAFETTLNSSGFPSKGDYGNSFLKLTLSGATLAVSDYFTMFNEVIESNADTDLGSGGIMLLPDFKDSGGTVRQLAVGAGKDTHLYVVDRDAMGNFTSGSNNIWQQLSGALPGGIWSTPAYFNTTVYYGPVGSPLMAFTIASAKLGASLPGEHVDQLRLSGHVTGSLGERQQQRHRLGARELRSGRAARLRRQRLESRALQQLRRPPAGATSSAPATSSSPR